MDSQSCEVLCNIFVAASPQSLGGDSSDLLHLESLTGQVQPSVWAFPIEPGHSL